jgi:alpha-tubulin suppressor-like RCC1 family protein
VTRAFTVLGLVFALCASAACSGEPPTSSETELTSREDTIAPLAPSAPGSLWSAGLNETGQLGRPADDRTAVELAPVRGTAATGVVAIAGGGRHSLAVLQDGTVFAWGADDKGQLGLGRTGGDSGSGKVASPDGNGPLRGVVAVAADTDFSMALRSDGTVVTWGSGGAGQRGDGTKFPPERPTVVLSPDGDGPLRGVTQIAADGRTELALLRDGRVVAWGANTYGMLGDGTRVDRELPVYVTGEDGDGELQGVQRVAVGGQHGLALRKDGCVLSWGLNDEGQLGSGDQAGRLAPGPVRGVGGSGTLCDVAALSAAEKHTLALRRDGTVVAWGNNTAGQLGDGSTTPRTTPVAVVGGGSGPQLRGVRQIASGEAFGAAVLSDGSLRTWGANGQGQLGAGDRVNRDRPGPVTALAGGRLAPVLRVAAGERHLLVLTDDSQV